MMSDAQPRVIETKRHAITQDYVWSNRVLGLGINGKVVECTSKTTGEKCALKVCIFSFDIINDTSCLIEQLCMILPTLEFLFLFPMVNYYCVHQR